MMPKKSVLATFIILACFVSVPPQGFGGNNELHVQQIGASHESTVTQVGTSNRTLLSQGVTPQGNEVENALSLSPRAGRFDFLDPLPAMTEPNGELLGSEKGFTGQGGVSIKGILADLPTGSAGQMNTARVRQTGEGNRALAVQLGGGNILATVQNGNDNLGVHIQTGDANNTRLIQNNANNTNALIARGGVTGPTGGRFTMRAEGNVDGLSVDLQGQQNFGSITAGRNGTGGYNINLRR
jgi:hypothetical protein